MELADIKFKIAPHAEIMNYQSNNKISAYIGFF